MKYLNLLILKLKFILQLLIDYFKLNNKSRKLLLLLIITWSLLKVVSGGEGRRQGSASAVRCAPCVPADGVVNSVPADAVGDDKEKQAQGGQARKEAWCWPLGAGVPLESRGLNWPPSDTPEGNTMSKSM